MKTKRNLFGFRKRVSKDQLAGNLNRIDSRFESHLDLMRQINYNVSNHAHELKKLIDENYDEVVDNKSIPNKKMTKGEELKMYILALEGDISKKISVIGKEIIENVDFNSDLIRERQAHIQENINSTSDKFTKNYRSTRDSIVDLNDKVRELKDDIAELKRMPVVQVNDCNNRKCTTQPKNKEESAYIFATIRQRGNLIAIDDRVMTSAEVATHLGVSRRAVTNNVAGLDRVKKNGAWFFKTKEVENYSQKKVAKLHRN